MVSIMLFESSFFFLSSIKKQRQVAIIEFYNGLSTDQQNMIDEMIADKRDETEFELGDN